jgi:hypothetical protein
VEKKRGQGELAPHSAQQGQRLVAYSTINVPDMSAWPLRRQM